MTTNELIGFGEQTVKISNSEGKTICYINKNEEVYFGNKALSIIEILAVADLISRKKLKKAIEHGEIQKAQEIVTKKSKEIFKKQKKK